MQQLCCAIITYLQITACAVAPSGLSVFVLALVLQLMRTLSGVVGAW